MVLTIGLGQLTDELLPKLHEVYTENGGELRLDLPEEWSIFFKQREGESRLLIAHPQQEQWVATVALDGAFAAKAIHEVQSLTPGQSFKFSQVGSIGTVSNLELIITAA